MTTTQPVNRGEVPEAFDEVADRYDLMVGLNPGYHAHLRTSARALVESLPAQADPVRMVDLGCGSGASTRALVTELQRKGRAFTLVGIDGSAGMLREARAKTWPASVAFAQGRAEKIGELPELAEARAAGGLDGIFAAYLVRNVPERDELLASLHDQLRPGATLVVHEYSVKGNRVATAVWTAVCQVIVVPLGWLTSRRTRLYRYLWRSVMDMDSVEELEGRLRTAGFEGVGSRTIGGWQRGIIHTFSARRPL
ncbi:ubiquinone biosynthesis methyltransferase UbiE [Intrasporangium oryzae NRRL B-24470]|uniref:Ubiquinone biosynthesis methyltransferase UbiE n=1 Tax=Intrasporangium oryzae NRRL B-24470 TaxID=1386089 RepID=W9GF84_9MICO|nr:class I SAM-dependent methyltransferase [Intrasporangium oryzae]EWT02499.1 ubiquinone biosynthesis methyltransferase UbiE [Intrasporangium oryzae NRRL B-24470]